MEEKDAKIRKQWLVVFCLNMIQSAAWIILSLFFNPQLAGVEFNAYPQLIFGFGCLIVMNYAIYHFAYKKHGTKLLTVLLFVAFLGMITTPILYLSGKMDALFSIPFYGAGQIISYLFGIYWIVGCLRIRKVNQKLRAATIK